jgi:hypothetical protein
MAIYGFCENKCLQDISNVSLCVDSIAEMKNLSNLVNENYIRTAGYYSINDGGGALYLIRERQETDVENLGAIHFINDSLVAELITNNANPMNFGCYGDGEHDDTRGFKKCIDYAKKYNKKIKCDKFKTFLINEPLDVSNTFIDFGFATLKTTSAIDILIVNTQKYYTDIKNINIDCNNIATSAINIIEGRKVNISYFNLLNVTNKGIFYQKGYEIDCRNGNITGNENSINSIGIHCNGGDSYFSDIIIIDLFTAIYNNQVFNTFNNIHAWILTKGLIVNSTMFRLNGSKCVMSNIYSDTYFYTIYQEQNIPQVSISNLTVLYNGGIMDAETMGDKLPYLFYCETEYGESKTNINGGIIYGLTWANPGGILTNKEHFISKMCGVLFHNYDKSMSFSQVSDYGRTEGVAVVEETLYKENNLIALKGIYKVDATNTKAFAIGTLPYGFKLPTTINTFCTCGAQWNINELAYMYIDNNGLIRVTVPENKIGETNIKIDFIGLIDNTMD